MCQRLEQKRVLLLDACVLCALSGVGTLGLVLTSPGPVCVLSRLVSLSLVWWTAGWSSPGCIFSSGLCGKLQHDAMNESDRRTTGGPGRAGTVLPSCSVCLSPHGCKNLRVPPARRTPVYWTTGRKSVCEDWWGGGLGRPGGHVDIVASVLPSAGTAQGHHDDAACGVKGRAGTGGRPLRARPCTKRCISSHV